MKNVNIWTWGSITGQPGVPSFHERQEDVATETIHHFCAVAIMS